MHLWVKRWIELQLLGSEAAPRDRLRAVRGVDDGLVAGDALAVLAAADKAGRGGRAEVGGSLQRGATATKLSSHVQRPAAHGHRDELSSAHAATRPLRDRHRRRRHAGRLEG